MSRAPPTTAAPHAPHENHHRETWAAGDFSRVATGQTIVGELLCETVELHARERVLDVATGSGNTALAAARRRAVVTAVDFVPALLERGRERAAAERLEVDFQEGSAERLPFPDGTFDCVLSTFGVMFSPEPDRAASELLRVCRSGGRIGLASWTPDGFVGELFATTARHAPSLEILRTSTTWGTEPGLARLFGGRTSRLSAVVRTVVMRADSPEVYLRFFRRYFGPTIKAFESLDRTGQEALEADLFEVVRAANVARDGTTYVPAAYLEAVVSK